MNQEPKSGMNPIVKAGLACCAILGLLCVLSCVGLGFWASSWVKTDAAGVAARFQGATGTALPSQLQGQFSIDMSPAPMSVHFAAESDPKALTVIVVQIPPAQNQPLPEHMIAWKQVAGPIAPQLAAQGIVLPTADALSIQDTGEYEDKELKVGDKTFKAIVIPCKLNDGTPAKRIYVELAGNSGLIAVGSEDAFDQEAFEAVLGGCTPR